VAPPGVSDVTFLPDFWGQPAWYFVHGIHHGGLYPAVVNLGFHREWAVFAGVQRLRRDLSDEEMEVLDTIREPLTSAIAFRSELDRAVRRLQRMRVDDEPPKPANCSAEAALPERTNRTVSGLQSRRPARPPIRVPPVPDEPMAFIAAPLTDREAEVLALVAAGWTSHKVGRVLAISERTVRKHLGNVYEKLGVSGRTSAAAWWLTHGVGKV
jgi:DNA-binding NarL/FixJ family response regulator